MSGQKLVESRAGLFQSPKGANQDAQDAQGLGLKVTGLRISTDNASMWRASLRVCAIHSCTCFILTYGYVQDRTNKLGTPNSNNRLASRPSALNK